jgi:threonine/homoserine/homoserine lactone efflux protein
VLGAIVTFVPAAALLVIAPGPDSPLVLRKCCGLVMIGFGVRLALERR